jgi:hypothetical protein
MIGIGRSAGCQSSQAGGCNGDGVQGLNLSEQAAPKTITGVKIGMNAHFKGFRPQGEALLALLVGSLSVTLSVGRESGGGSAWRRRRALKLGPLGRP